MSDETIDRLSKKTAAQNTAQSYASDLRSFDKFCRDNGMDNVVKSSRTVLKYICHEYERGISVATIKRRLSAISTHKGKKYSRMPKIKNFLDGAARERGTAQRTAKPLSLSNLQHTIRTLNSGDIFDVRNRALICIGWAAALRRSEIVSLLRGDVDFDADGMIVTIRKSKTDQTAKGWRLGIPWAPQGSEFCFARTVREWLSRSNYLAPMDSFPLFFRLWRRNSPQEIMIKDGIVRPLAAISVNRILSRCLDHAGLLGNDYTAHSLRAGLITELARIGTPNHAIRKMSRHKSDTTMEGYIREGSLFTANPLNALFDDRSDLEIDAHYSPALLPPSESPDPQ